MRIWLSAAAALAVLVSPAGCATALAQARNTDLVWRTIRTRHFEITYHEPLGLVARRVGVVAERAHATLAPMLGHAPHERTRVLLTDSSDSANGSATVTPFNAIRLFATGPEDLSPLSDYDDWLGELVTHEYTHVLHLDTIGGIPAVINAVFGKIYPPNSVQPRWFLEGLATYEESARSSGGRLRSSIFDMYLRMQALDDGLLRLDQISNGVDSWPRGNIWYLYGSRFVQYIARRFGVRALAQMSHDYGRQLIPYGLNRAARRATGHSFVELYDDFVEQTERRYARVAERVRAQGLITGRRITFLGERVGGPRFLDDDRIVYWTSDGRSRSQLRSTDAATGAGARMLTRAEGATTPAPHPDGRHIVYGAQETFRDIYFFYDLFRYDRQTGDVMRLTHGARAKEPDVSPDGRQVVFTVNGAATTHLVLAELSDIEGTRRVLVRSPRFGQVYTPRFSPDGASIAFSAWDRNGYRDVKIVDIGTGRVSPVTRDRAMDTGPAWSRDGRWLFFSSDRTGIANIYAYDTTSGLTAQVTNVMGGAFQPTVSPSGDRLVYVGFSQIGFDLWTLELRPETWRRAAHFVDRRPEPANDDDDVLVAASEPYDPIPTLLPRAWMLELAEDGFGSELSLTFSGEDIVGYHSYTGSIGVSLERPNVNADLQWRFNHTPLPVHLRLFRIVAPRGGLVVAGERRRWIEEAVGGEVGISYALPTAFHSEDLHLSYALSHLGQEERFGGRLDPNDPPPTLPETGLLATVRVGWSWSDVTRTTFDVSASEGRRLTFGMSIAHPLLGSAFQTVSASWSIAQYVENPWIEHHVLALRYAGGLSGGDLGRRGTFSVGGFPRVGLLEAVTNNLILGGAALRGYPSFDRSGTQFHLLQTEYRFPIFRPYRGLGTLPAYLKRLWGLAFLDVGDAFFGRLDLSTFRFGVGGELLADFVLGYFLDFTLRVGLARGLSEGGETQVYANIGFPF